MLSTRSMWYWYGCGSGEIMRRECREDFEREIENGGETRDYEREIYSFLVFLYSFYREIYYSL